MIEKQKPNDLFDAPNMMINILLVAQALSSLLQKCGYQNRVAILGVFDVATCYHNNLQRTSFEID